MPTAARGCIASRSPPIAARRSSPTRTRCKSRTFLAHIRHATAGEPTLQNTHPFEQHGRLFAHNGVLGGLDALRSRLGEHASLVQGSTDSELYFTLMTKRIEEHGGDVAAGIAHAAREIAAEIPLYSLNMVLTTPTDVWALRYPDTNELWVLERSIAALGGPDGGGVLDERAASGITRVFSGQLAILPATVIASQPMDTNPLWRRLESGELIHVDSRASGHLDDRGAGPARADARADVAGGGRAAGGCRRPAPGSARASRPRSGRPGRRPGRAGRPRPSAAPGGAISGARTSVRTSSSSSSESSAAA